jgi:hypothetical protein
MRFNCAVEHGFSTALLRSKLDSHEKSENDEATASVLRGVLEPSSCDQYAQ